jgi:hypothetical protein
MKVKRTRPIIEITQKELNALHTAIEFLDDLDSEDDIRENFMGSGYSQLQELVIGLDEVIDFLEEEQEDFIINVVNKEEN